MPRDTDENSIGMVMDGVCSQGWLWMQFKSVERDSNEGHSHTVINPLGHYLKISLR